MAVNNVLTTGDNTITDPISGLQYIRKFKLVVSDNFYNGLDLSQLHCKFTIKRSSNMTPNCADIRVYNVKTDTAVVIQQMFKKVLMEGGYDSNNGVIFRGNIKQVILGRESAIDTFIDLVCGDGDLAYNFAIVNTPIVAGSTQAHQLNQIAQPMQAMGITQQTNLPVLKPFSLPRGKVLWGAAKDAMRTFAAQNGLTWSFQNSQLQLIPQQGYAKGTTVTLTSKTGMIGTPQQTNIGVNVVCLMNPLINPGRTIKIDNASVQDLKVDLGNPKDPVNLAPPLTADGVYYVLVIEQTGDNRGVDWYSKLICCTVNPASNPINSVSVTYGP